MKHRTVIHLVISFVAIALLVACKIYINRINIYEPLQFNFNGIEPEEDNQITVYGISPLNKKITIIDYEKYQQWDSDGMFFYSIGFEVPDSIAVRIDTITVKINRSCQKYTLSECYCLKSNNGITDYRFPEKLKSNFSLQKALRIVFNSVYFLVTTALTLAILAFVIWRKRLQQKGQQSRSEIRLQYFKMLGWVAICFATASFVFVAFLFLFYGAINLLTAMFFIVIIISIVAAIVCLAARLMRLTQDKTKQIWKVSAIICSVLLLVELGLRLLGVNTTYNETIGSFYVSGYKINRDFKRSDNPYIYTYRPNSVSFYNRKEFNYKLTTNSEGLRDFERQIVSNDSAFRIIAIGNSFTEGAGAPQDSTWPAILEKKLSEFLKKEVEVFNAGVSSSDPFFGYMLYEEKLNIYKPDMVLLALGSTDFEFYKYRGGFERFTKNGLRYKDAPMQETWYALSYIYRLFLNNIMGYKGFHTQKETQQFYDSALRDIEDCIEKFKKKSRENNFEIIIVFIDDNKPIYQPLIDKLKTENKIKVIDLFEYNAQYFANTGALRKDYYWPLDGHCNSSGYELFAKGIYEKLTEINVKDLNEL